MRTLRELAAQAGPPTAQQQAALGRWSGWGAVPEVFNPQREDLAWARNQLAELLDDTELARARESTLNAHYTDPDLAELIWSAVGDLGFEGGRVLEPGCGSGTFLGLAPQGCEMVGVEVEPTTAAIARALQPQAQILTESFADTRAADGAFDLVIGNVPFAKTVLSDRLHNSGRHSIHNHFILKGLRLTAPGGHLAVITSRYTLDSRNPAARREMSELADLVGAVRLPKAAHQRTAGTQVITDLLVFRRREPDRAPEPFDWELTDTVEVDGQQVRLNSRFLAHPEMMCGQLHVGHGQYGAAEPQVVSERRAAELLAERLDVVVAEAEQRGLRHAPTAPQAPRPAALVGASDALEDGHIVVADDGAIWQVVGGSPEPMDVPKSRQAEVRALVGLRDTATALLEAEARTYDHRDDIEQMRAELGRRYDAYAARYGPINRVTWRRTGRVDEDGNPQHSQVSDRLGGFRTDPRAPLVLALERFDATTNTAARADIFAGRVVAPRTPPRGADTPADALAICLDTHGRVELAAIADLLGTSEQEARAGLGRLVFADPQQPDRQGQPGALVAAADYLSGHVRDKLAAARAAAEQDPAFEVNVQALTEVVPPDIAPEDIAARLGVPWISDAVVQQFLRETLQDQRLTVERLYGTRWSVEGDQYSVTATSTWGTERYPAPELAHALLEQRSIAVYDEVDAVTAGGAKTTRRVLNPGATTAAQARADELAERFSDWVWEDPQRATELARIYNDRFNSIVLRNYDDVELSLPGLALTFTPARHQVAAVARIIAEPTVGLYHEVGAGKTAEMAMGVMELRRLNLVRKPAIVIPNHMIEQWSREFQTLYPRARLLAASSADLTRDARRAFVARVATGDWDAVILTRGAFERIPMSAENQEAYLDDELAELEAAINAKQAAQGEDSRSVKKLVATLKAAKERIKDKLDTDYDPAITFERSGIDYVVVDEAHDFKNLRTASAIAGAAIDGSGRAQDLDMKLHYLRAQHGDRVTTLATATPIANSITEAHVMQRYLRPDLLRDAGVRNFDAWAATFAAVVTDVEISPDGSSFRMKGRFARFHNVPELLRMWWVSGDVKTAEDLQLPRPEIWPRPEDGERAPRTVTVAATEGQQQLIDELGARAEKVQSRAVDKSVDNMLLISSHGRAGALDLRLLGRDTPPGESKIDVAADQIAELWARHRDDVFVDADGAPHPRRGGMQLVFCDLGTPGSSKRSTDSATWNVYDELRDQLVARGLPRSQVRFIHEAGNDRKKADLFAACRAGEVAVLVGSTSKMGVGTNVQDRAVALHHLDCPWRPADLAQRDGRALRRGNQYGEIGLFRYVVAGTFDAYMWQACARKAAFISQLMNGTLTVREIDGDIGDSALSYSEVKALAAGNPLLMDKAKADAELTKLERLERSHTHTRARLRYTIEETERRGPELDRQRAALLDAIERRTDTRADRFGMVVRGHRFDDRSEAGQRLLDELVAAAKGPSSERATEIPAIARLGGLDVDATVWTSKLVAGYELRLSGLDRGGSVSGSRDQLLETAHGGRPHSIAVRLENLLSGLDLKRDSVEQDIDRCRTEQASARAQLDKPFAHADALTTARRRVREIDDQLQAMTAPSATEPANHPQDGTQSAESPETSAPDGRAREDRPNGPGVASTDSTAPVALDGRNAERRPHPAGVASAALTPSRPRTGGPPGSPPQDPAEDPVPSPRRALPAPQTPTRPDTSALGTTGQGRRG